MAEVYARAWRGNALLEGPVEDAVELNEPGLATAQSHARLPKIFTETGAFQP